MKRRHVIYLGLFAWLAISLVQHFGLARGHAASDANRNEPTQRTFRERAQLGSSVSVRAEGLGRPQINLQDGHDLLTTYAGAEIKQVLEAGSAQPLAVAAGDFDEDGVPDLVGGYDSPSGSFAVLHRGNVDSIYPNTPEAEQRKARGEFTDAPFLSPAQVFELPQRQDFIGAGDFDADGHLDLVMATTGDEKLVWLTGDGRGGFGSARELILPGTVTAMSV